MTMIYLIYQLLINLLGFRFAVCLNFINILDGILTQLIQTMSGLNA